MLNRIVDLVVSLVGLLLLLVMLPVIALLIKLDSPGPVFYVSRRVGRGGRIFRMYKFRTMYETPKPVGASVSPQGDPRVTEVGRWLRRLKLNEFPQFINVLKGDMTLVGPRPEAPDLAIHYPPEAQKIFSVKPGLVGPSQILGRNEEELYPRGEDPVKFYLEHILPHKLQMDLQYVENKTFLKDMAYLVKGAWVTLAGAVSRQHLTDNLTQILMLGADTLACLVSFTMAHYIRFGGFPADPSTQAFWRILPLTVLARIPLLYYFGCYQTLIRYLGLNDLKKVFKGILWGTLFLVVLSFVSGSSIILESKSQSYSRSVFFMDYFILTVMLGGYRAFLKTAYQRYAKGRDPQGVKRVALIWGTGDLGLWCLRYLEQCSNPRYEVVGFIDDDPSLQYKRLDGLRVLGDHHHLEVLVQLYHIQDIFVALSQIPPGRLERVQELCHRLNLTLSRFQPHVVQEMAAPVMVADQPGTPVYPVH
jgi:lipopolysaccharide/colanic/teichoic acid biosynthesis glycosyltransferase